jgi:hypothetical protein
MIVFLMLVIIAILLFGSSAILGAIGAVAGIFFAVVALAFAGYHFNLPNWVIIAIPLLLLVSIPFFAFLPDNIQKIRLWRERRSAIKKDELLSRTKSETKTNFPLEHVLSQPLSDYSGFPSSECTKMVFT